jgi:hypothetical protein
MQQAPTFFISGTIQGSRRGTGGVDQGYRSALQELIRRHYRDAIIHCPLEVLRSRFAANLDQALAAYEQETAAETLYGDRFSPLVSEVRAAFIDLVTLASQADVLVAYLPGHEASMGTAMEMWSAYFRGRVIVTISSMTQNLAIVSTSTVILPSVEQFDHFLAGGSLDDLIARKRGQA